METFTADQTVRLAALDRAINYYANVENRASDPDKVMETAAAFERYLRG